MTAKQKTQWKSYGIFKDGKPVALYSQVIKNQEFPVLALFRWRHLATKMVRSVGDKTVHVAPVTISLSTKPRGKRG